jgi:ADP-ribose pyrophosphatase
MEYPKPSLTADMCVYARENDALYVLLIRRGNPPYRSWWAFPGGFVDPGETVEHAAARELAEETGVEGLDFELVGIFSEAGRDPRGWSVTAAFRAEVDRNSIHAVGMDDAAEARWFRVFFTKQYDALHIRLVSEEQELRAVLKESYLSAGRLRYAYLEQDGIAFDHAKILAAALYDN